MPTVDETASPTQEKIKPPASANEVLDIFQMSQDEAFAAFLNTPLDESYSTIYATRKKRDVVGSDGVVVRSIGFFDGETFSNLVYDEKRKKFVAPEFAEFRDELAKFKETKAPEAAIHAYMEVADIYFQLAGVDIRDDITEREKELTTQYLGFVLQAVVRPMLQEEQLDYALALQIGRIKYGVRAKLNELGYEGKHDGLETQLCLMALEKWNTVIDEEKPEILLAQLEFGSVEEMYEHIMTSENTTLEELIATKYGTRVTEAIIGKETFTLRPTRYIRGPNSIDHRVFGREQTGDAINQWHTREGQYRRSDYGQFEEALADYKSLTTKEKEGVTIDAADKEKATIALLQRAAAFKWQETILLNTNTPSNERDGLEGTFFFLQHYVNSELSGNGIDTTLVDDVARVMYASRVYVDKQPALEYVLCQQAINSRVPKTEMVEAIV